MWFIERSRCNVPSKMSEKNLLLHDLVLRFTPIIRSVKLLKAAELCVGDSSSASLAHLSQSPDPLLSDWPVHGLPQLRGARLGEGQPGPGAVGHDVQRRLAVGPADDPQQTHGPAEGAGLHQVHPRGSGNISFKNLGSRGFLFFFGKRSR